MEEAEVVEEADGAMRDAMAELVARTQGKGSAGSEQQLAKIAGLDKKVAELAAELKLYAHMSL
jgi:hypothetical protein